MAARRSAGLVPYVLESCVTAFWTMPAAVPLQPEWTAATAPFYRVVEKDRRAVGAKDGQRRIRLVGHEPVPFDISQLLEESAAPIGGADCGYNVAVELAGKDGVFRGKAHGFSEDPIIFQAGLQRIAAVNAKIQTGEEPLLRRRPDGWKSSGASQCGRKRDIKLPFPDGRKLILLLLSITERPGLCSLAAFFCISSAAAGAGVLGPDLDRFPHRLALDRLVGGAFVGDGGDLLALDLLAGLDTAAKSRRTVSSRMAAIMLSNIS